MMSPIGPSKTPQTERANRGMVKMLSMPVNRAGLSLAKFAVLLLMAAVQMAMAAAAYYVSALVAARVWDYDFVLGPGYVCWNVLKIYAAALPMAAVYWAIANLISTPVFSIGVGLASIVPSVLMINTKFWFAYPMSYPFYMLMIWNSF